MCGVLYQLLSREYTRLVVVGIGKPGIFKLVKYVSFVWFKNVDSRICTRISNYDRTESRWSSTVSRVIRRQTQVIDVRSVVHLCAHAFSQCILGAWYALRMRVCRRKASITFSTDRTQRRRSNSLSTTSGERHGFCGLFCVAVSQRLRKCL